MRIRTQIFIWVFLATVLPLTALTLGMTYTSQAGYQRDVDREILTQLEHLSGNLSRQLASGRELALGIARAPTVQAALPLLATIADGRAPADLAARRADLNRYFEGFRTLIPGVFVLRLLDAQGNSLVKVTRTHTSRPLYESLGGLRYVEQEIVDPGFLRSLREAPADEVAALYLPHNRNELNHSFLLRDAVVPLHHDGRFVGALALTLLGDQLDKILDHTPRLYEGELLLLESDPDRHPDGPTVLYSDAGERRFAQLRAGVDYFDAPWKAGWLDQLATRPEGVWSDGQGHLIHYSTWLPWPNQLTEWHLALRTDAALMAAPFERIRLGIAAFAATALLLTLVLSALGARRIARPLRALAGRIERFAEGEHRQHVATDQPIDEVRELARAFNYLSDTLAAAEAERDRAQHMALQSNKLASIGQMAAGIGHELNNPLNNILSYARLIERDLRCENGALDADACRQLRADLASLREETLRASQIVQGILNFARQVPPTYGRIEVCPWLEKTLALVRQAARARHVELRLDCAADAFEGDAHQLQQALVNLLLNAIQASPDGGQVDITARETGDRLIMVIRDRGAGIPAPARDRIFDPFFTTKAEGEGSGLGLSISLGIVERHGGSLQLDNHPEGGAEARLELPRKARDTS